MLTAERVPGSEIEGSERRTFCRCPEYWASSSSSDRVTVTVSYLTRSVVGMDDQEMLTPRVPPKLQHLMDEPALATAWEHQVAARQAEAAKITALLEHVATRRAEHQHELEFIGSSRFVVNDPAVAGIHATVLAALVSRIRVR